MTISTLKTGLLILVATCLQSFGALPSENNSGLASLVKQGDLVSIQGKGIHHFDEAQLAGTRFFGIYYSASWCGPCRAFTPKLVKFYEEIKAANPQFEVIFVSRDRSLPDMQDYMNTDQMKWPALVFPKIRSHEALTRYAGKGIPCLVLVDAQGNVLSNSYEGTKYVGPTKVMEDIKRILAENPPTPQEIAAAKAFAQKNAAGSKPGESNFNDFFKKATPKP